MDRPLTPLALGALSLGSLSYSTYRGVKNQKLTGSDLCIAVFGLALGGLAHWSESRFIEAHTRQAIGLKMPKANWIRPTSDNVGSVWQEGDFMVAGMHILRDQVRVSAGQLNLSPTKELFMGDHWLFTVDGEVAAHLVASANGGAWRKADLLRSLEQINDKITFKHLPTDQVYTAIAKKVPCPPIFRRND